MILSALMFHIVSGALALLAGYAIILCKKGRTVHKYLGRVYVTSMIILGLTGTYIAVIRNVPISILNGLVLCYFVLSALNIMWQPANRVNFFDKILMAFAFLLTLGFAWYAYQTTQAPDGQLAGFGIAAFLVFGSVMALSTIADFRYIKRGGLGANNRLTRHLWRMYFPLFMSTAAFFLGQSRHLPEVLQRAEFLLTPVALVICTAVYWVVKIKCKKSNAQIY
ncbi:DUF2306 domain-containing protein [Pseudoalteromonas byunsanensis]|uniref:DUF2306 domain-containing protein n=1 Tax=Pseudoalteromonas byunsanensis TaxID=327939 RepID=A0A1S1N750_9GAMM|nr:DUF2306 domain-containing protein [Pseudoalteromonas byunsanensis]OHU95169.1 hypothetical protein BIW53_10605 [Pseudoalteromonas byunsanensis]